MNSSNRSLPSGKTGKHNSAAAAAGLFIIGMAWLPGSTEALAAEGDQPPELKPRNVVPVFRLDGPITEVPADDFLQMFSAPGASLRDLVRRIGKAAVDPQVKAVVVLPEFYLMGPAQTEELLAALALVRKEGKEVFVHADSLISRQYVLACGASRISVVPAGAILIAGLHASSLHVRGLLDRIGVKPDFLTEGAYKSAAELFMREQPSPEADEMMNWLMDSWYAQFKAQIAEGRKADPGKVQSWLDSGLFTAERARASGLIDAVEQRQDFEAMLKERYGQDVIFDKRYGRKNQPELDLSSPFGLLKLWAQFLNGPETKSEPKPAVGIVYVDGPINLGKGMGNPFGGSLGAFSSDVREALEQAAADDSIKAVVLRIDSPGGSVTASEIILDATRRVKVKKPLVVSMGDVAGSGGYYVACAADTIFADATSLTGSIGVLGGKLATTEMWKKIGITFKEYKRGQNAGIFSTDEVFTESERGRMRALMDEAYDLFKQHVIEIRGSRLRKPVEELAGGRVYTGKQALDLGLVDRIGTLSDAVAFAADQAKLGNYGVRVVPEPKNFLEQLTERVSRDKKEPGHISSAVEENTLYKLAAPYLQNLDPQRTAAVMSAFRRLEILQREGIVLSMPEILAEP